MANGWLLAIATTTPGLTGDGLWLALWLRVGLRLSLGLRDSLLLRLGVRLSLALRLCDRLLDGAGLSLALGLSDPGAPIPCGLVLELALAKLLAVTTGLLLV